MTGNYLLDWPMMAVSLFNTILLLWLGLTVLLNAERRSWGLWLAGGSLLLGGLFFVSHSAILGLGLTYTGQGMDFWWRFGWGPVVALPFAWYVIMLWYAGFWEAGQAGLQRRQRPWFGLALGLAVSLVGLLIFANPLPSFWQVTQLRLSATPALGGLPLLILVYPFYILLCTGLSLDVLRHPEPSARMMGDLARWRAQPWLTATSLTLLLVSLLVAWVMVWVVLQANPRTANQLYTETLTVAWFDLVIAGLIGLATLLVGQAIVAYEIFTGTTLPRRGLRRQWQRAIILAAGYGLVVGWSVAVRVEPIYALLLSTLLVVLFFAMLSWRSYAERERSIERLRPFVASQRLYDSLTTPAPPPEVDGFAPFRALCEGVLGAKRAYLIPLGSLAPLAGPPLRYPPAAPPPPPIGAWAADFTSPHIMCLPLEPNEVEARWAVPLWSERGLIGLLLLGEKQDGGLYTQEEIEIARASGERLIDTQASAEMARRLMAIQRERLVHSQVVDRQTRRVLHDDVLPRLHTAMLTLSGDNGGSAGTVALLGQVHGQISDLLRDIPPTTAPEVTRLGLIGALRRMVEAELGHAFDEITWQLAPEAERQARRLPSLTAEVLFYAAREVIRNAARHARAGSGRPLHLMIAAPEGPDNLTLIIEDNGVGLAPAEVAQNSSRGLALHSTMLAVVGGTLTVESVPETYTKVTLTIPQPEG